ncbi:DUF7139 domain-containing protein [Halovenus marina]|uniref:DUF7139 domain-containing protein n=1 Tax=Halovenus marina TaxID=3396621 RepID=UPI003F554AC6
MPSLGEAYDRRGDTVRQPRRVLAGLVLVGSGVVGLLVALGLIAVAGASITARSYAGLAAGVGIPLMLLGVVVVLPSSREIRVGVLFGTAISGVGVWLFSRAYPDQWVSAVDSIAFETLFIYGVGCAIALWFVFAAIATFRRRNNPYGTVRLEVVRQGETQTVEVSSEQYRQLADGGNAESVIREIERSD